MEIDCISDYVVAILKSPTWIAPIQKFVDEKSIIFEDQEENKLEYTIVHNAFKNLVDDLLAAHLCELSVTEEQFAQFCQHGLTGDNEVHRSIVEHLLSVDDFLVFKAMMVKRNAELGREACAAATAAAAADPSDLGTSEGDQTEAWQHAEQLEAQQRCVEAELQMAQALELQLEKRLELMEELNKVLDLICMVYKLQADVLAVEAAAEAAAARDQAQQEAAASAAQAAGQKASYETIRLQPLTDAPALPAGGGSLPDTATVALQAKKAEVAQQRDRALAVAASAAPEPPPAAPAAPAVEAAAAPPRPTEAERQARAEHLRQSRAALLERKQREREAQLSAHQQQHGVTVASRTAEQKLMSGPTPTGQSLAAELSGQAAEAPPPQNSDTDGKALQMRQMLARQLRATLTHSAP